MKEKWLLLDSYNNEYTEYSTEKDLKRYLTDLIEQGESIEGFIGVRVIEEYEVNVTIDLVKLNKEGGV